MLVKLITTFEKTYRVFKKHILFQLRRFASDRNQKVFNPIMSRWNRGHRKGWFGGFLTLAVLTAVMWLVVAMNDYKVEFTRSLSFFLSTLATRLSFHHHNNYGALQPHLELNWNINYCLYRLNHFIFGSTEWQLLLKHYEI